MVKVILSAVFLIAGPVAAYAQCSHQTSMSCAEGMVWDEASATCITATS